MIKVSRIRIPEFPTRKARRLYVYLPRGYDRGSERYPVLYMFDGHNVFFDSHATYGKSWGMKQYLERTGRKIILVAVECNPEGFRRLNEYSPWDFRESHIGQMEGLGKVTMDWMTRELKPWVDETYRTLPDREHTWIAGSSMGGLMSLYAAVEYNAVFSRAAALSPSLWVSPRGMKELLRSCRLESPTAVYMDLGSAEVGEHLEAFRGMFRIAGLLSQKGAAVAARIVPGAEHCEAAWEKRIPVFFEYFDSVPSEEGF